MRIFAVVVFVAVVGVQAMAQSPVTVFEEGRNGPYANFLFTGTPEIVDVRRAPDAPREGQAVRVTAVVRPNTLAASMPVARVTLSYSLDGAATWTTVDMLRDDRDEQVYIADLPAAKQGAAVRYYVSAYDVAGSLSSEMPGYVAGFPQQATNMLSVTDENASDDAILPDVDVLALRVGYDEQSFYVQAEVEGKPGKGNMVGQGAYMYLIPVLNQDKAVGIGDFMNMDILAYAPMMGQMLGFGESGLFRISEVMETKKSIEGADVKFKKGPNSLNFRFNRAAVGDMPSGRVEFGLLTMAATSLDSMYPQEASPFITAYLRTHEYTVAPRGAGEPLALRAGVAETDITPPVGTPLAGYGARQGKPSTGVHDPLLAQALVIEAGGRKMVFLTSDFLLMRRSMYKDIASRVEKELGIPRERVIASGSHAHCSSGGMFPELALLSGNAVPGLYQDTLDKFVAVVKQADAALQPARMGFGTGDATGYSSNRVTEGGPIDPDLRVMRVDKADGKPLAILFNFGAHPTVLGDKTMEFSADFVGPARAAVKDAFPGVIAMYNNGAQGNQSPSCPGDCGGGFDKVEKTGRGLGNIAVNVAENIKTQDKLPVTFLTREIIIQPDYDIRITMSGVRFGDTAMLTIPGEMFVELADPVKAMARDKGLKNLFLLGLTNDGIGYIVTPEAYQQRVYESTFALFGPGEGPFIQAQLLAMLDML
jgi:hypothetical protein